MTELDADTTAGLPFGTEVVLRPLVDIATGLTADVVTRLATQYGQMLGRPIDIQTATGSRRISGQFRPWDDVPANPVAR